MSNEVTISQMNEAIAFNGYMIYPDGRVFGKMNKFLRLAVASSGYVNLNLRQDGKQTTFLLHRVVATLFIPNPHNYPEVNHKDGNKLNNHYKNLEWVTRPVNVQHAYKTGLNKGTWTGKSGGSHHRSKTVIQLDLEGNEINRYGSSREAEKALGMRSIGDVLRGRNKTAGGFIWKYA